MPRPALCWHRNFGIRDNALITLRLSCIRKHEGLGRNGSAEEQQNSGAKEQQPPYSPFSKGELKKAKFFGCYSILIFAVSTAIGRISFINPCI